MSRRNVEKLDTYMQFSNNLPLPATKVVTYSFIFLTTNVEIKKKAHDNHLDNFYMYFVCVQVDPGLMTFVRSYIREISKFIGNLSEMHIWLFYRVKYIKYSHKSSNK